MEHPDEKTPDSPLPKPEQVATDNDLSPPRGNPFPVVGIGASAGGLEAFEALLSALPASTGMAFVLVQHLDPVHESVLPELLSRRTSMPVLAVQDGVRIEPDHVYVIPPNTSMELEDGTLRLASREPGLHLPIDIFFRSLASVQGGRAIAVVLSGNASDGSMGVRAIKAECGITFAQSEMTARFGGMPRNAIATGAIDYVLGPAEIGRELAALAHHPFLLPSRAGDSGSETLPGGDGELRRVFALLYGATKVDFSRYKPTTVRRRIGRRIMVLHLETMGEYARYVEHQPAELRELYRDLLISVTSFFRDPDTFDALRRFLTESVTSRDGRHGDPVRVWVPGCATGEEVYSLAICLFEILEDHKFPPAVQFFGTDLSDLALDRARRGVYPQAIEEAVSPERLRRFFTKVETGYQITKMVREACIFAAHDLTKDPPFSNLDLVSCRNLLIYLDHRTQRNVIPTFHYALKANGLLLLGSAESTAGAPEMFDVVDDKHRIYRRKAVPPRLPLDLSAPGAITESSGAGAAPASAAVEIQKRLERVIQSKYSPDCVLIDSDFQIIQFRGRTAAYLDLSPGESSANVLRLAKESLVLPLRRAIQQVCDTNTSARETGIEIDGIGERIHVTLEVTPVPGLELGRRYFLVVFAKETSPTDVNAEASPLSPHPQETEFTTLAQELGETRDSLRTVTEQFETYSEELRAANEEARSANEELQSTNEELRTTKQELQSANEELTTVNEELQSRNSELSDTNGDLKNLLSAVTVSILMVDGDLRVRRFNTAAANLLELQPLDVGRPIGHIRGRIETSRLELQVRNVVDTLHTISEEVQDSAGRWYALHIRPYRTLDDRIAGAVITLQDVDPLKRGLQAAEEARDYAEGIIETVREPLIVLDSDLRIQRATTAFYEAFLVTREETEGRFLYDLGNGQWNDPRLRELIGAALFRSEPFQNHELVHDFPHIGPRIVRLNGRRILLPHSQQRTLLLSIEDVTAKEFANTRFQRLFETAKDGILVVDLETQIIQDANPYFLDLTGFSREELVGKPLSEAAAELDLPDLMRGIAASRHSEIVRLETLHLKTRDQRTVTVDVVGNLYRVGSQPVVQFNVRDVSGRHQAQEALRESEQRFRLFVESVHDYALFQSDRQGLIVTWNAGAERLLGWKESEVIGKPTSLVFTPEDVEAGEDQRELETARTKGRAEDERWHLRKDGSRFFASGVLTQVCDEDGRLLGFAKIMRDNTARKQYEEQLRRSIAEKETLVREIHHRVKNNLQVIVSLLAMQSRHATDPQVLSAFNEAESRLRAIAQIHERLYASDDLSNVEFSEYVTGLAKGLAQLHSSAPERIELDFDVIDMALHVERAIPLGLIANELILNSLKHGLKGGTGQLRIRLAYVPGSAAAETLDTGWGQLQIADTGPGLPPGFDPRQTQSMGLRLVNMLVRQLRGHLEIGGGPGASWTVTFPLEDLRKLKLGAGE